MKVAFLSYYSGYIPRGVETFVFELSNRLAKNHEVTVYQGGGKISGAKYLTKEIKLPVDWRQKNSRGTISRRGYLDYWSLLIKRFTDQSLNDLPNDIDVLLPTNGGWETGLSRIWTWQRNSKLVITGHSGPGWDDRVNLLCRPDTFVAMTEFHKSWALRNGFGVKIEKIPNGVDTDVFSPGQSPARISLPRPIYICPAALEKGKRVDLVIKAFAKLSHGSLLIMGDGMEKDRLKKLAELLIPGRFLIIQVPYDQIAHYYGTADFLTVAPIPNESFGMVLIEGMAMNLPIVTTNDPIRKEIVGRAGLFVNPENIEEYTRALERVRTTKWDNVPRKQAEKFSWDKIANQYNNLINSLA